MLYLTNILRFLLNTNTNLKNIQSQSTNMVVFDIETYNTDRAFPYANCIYRLREISGKFYHDITEQENERCRKDCIVFEGFDKVNEMLDYVLQFKGEPKRIKKEVC